MVAIAMCLPFVAAPSGGETTGPVLRVQPDENALWTGGWEPGSALTLSIYDDDGGGLPGALWYHVDTAADLDGNAHVAVEADGQVDFPGRHVEVIGTAASGPVTKTHRVPLLTVEVDRSTAVVTGSTDLAADAVRIDVWGNYLDQHAYRLVTTPVPTDWGVDLAAVPDTAAGEEGVLTPPLEYGGEVVVAQVDADGDATEARVHLPSPRMHVNVVPGTISLVDFEADVPVSVEILDGGWLGPWSAIPSWRPGDTTEAQLDLHAELVLEPGMVVRATQGTVVKEHTVTGVVFTDNTTPDTDPPVVEFTVDPAEGAWTILQAFGENGSSAQYQYDLTGRPSPWTHAIALGADDADAVDQFGQVDPPLQLAWVDQFDDDGDSTVAQWGEGWPDGGGGEPWIGAAVWPDTYIFGEEFNGADLRVEIDTYPADGSPEFALDVPVDTYGEGIRYDGRGLDLRAPFWDDWDPDGAGPWSMHAGDVLTVTVLDGSGLVKQLDVQDITITGTDQSTATVTGTAPAGAAVRAHLWGDDFGNQVPEVETTADVDGDWSATFDTMFAGSGGFGMLVDDDGDASVAIWGAPLIAAGIDVDGSDGTTDVVYGGYWYHDTAVEIMVLRGADVVDGPRTISVDDGDWRGFGAQLDGFDLQVGDRVVVTGDLTQTELGHDVLDLSVEYELADAGNRVFGTVLLADGTPAVDHPVKLELHPEELDNHPTTTVGPDGNWSVELDPFGVQLTDESGGVVKVLDEVGNHTFQPWGNRGGEGGELPAIFASAFGFEYVEGVGWAGLEPLTVDIAGAACTATLTDVDSEEAPGHFFLSIDRFGEDCDLAPGDVITVTGNDGTAKSLVVSDLVVTAVDAAADTISGLAAPGSDLFLQVWTSDEEPPLELPVTAVDGTWTVHVGVDLVVDGPSGAIYQWDEDGDATQSDWFVPNPALIVIPAQDVVVLPAWPSGADVALNVRDAVGGTLVHTQTVPLPGPYIVASDVWVDDLGGFDLQPGHWVEAVTPSVTRGFTVSPVQVTDVDFGTATVSGVADAGAAGFLDMGNASGGCEAGWDATAESWAVDLASACPDFTLGTHVDGAVGQVMLDGTDFQGVTADFWSADHVVDTVVDGGTVSSGDGVVGPEDPVHARVTAPSGTTGSIAITRTTVTGTVTNGFVLLGSQVTVTAPPLPEGSDPYVLELVIDDSIAPSDLGAIQVLRDGVVVPDCPDPAGYPCVAARARDATTGDVTVTVHTLEFSTWVLATPRAFAVLGQPDGPVDPVPVGSEVSVVGFFDDTLPNVEHWVIWDWGDGTSTIASADPGTVVATHTYAEAGIHTVTMTVVASDGHEEARSFDYVVVYDPSGGFVTGGGWFDSPAGALKGDPELTGRATFGFVAKYHKGADVPDGETEFEFRAGDLEFRSTSYDWLVVTGKHRAQFKGDGTVGGVEGYQFMLTAVDDEPDAFRIRIWEASTGQLVYDNGPTGSGESELGGGSVVIHTRGKSR